MAGSWPKNCCSIQAKSIVSKQPIGFNQRKARSKLPVRINMKSPITINSVNKAATNTALLPMDFMVNATAKIPRIAP